MMLTLFKWLCLGYVGLLLALSLFAFSAACLITRNISVSLKFCIYFAVDLTFQLFSRAIGNILAAFATDSNGIFAGNGQKCSGKHQIAQ